MNWGPREEMTPPQLLLLRGERSAASSVNYAYRGGAQGVASASAPVLLSVTVAPRLRRAAVWNDLPPTVIDCKEATISTWPGE